MVGVARQFCLVRISFLFPTAAFFSLREGVILAIFLKIFLNQEGFLERGLWWYAETKTGDSCLFYIKIIT